MWKNSVSMWTTRTQKSSVIFLSTLTERGKGVMMESSGPGMASLTLLNYTDGECVWLLIIWQALYVCVCVCCSGALAAEGCEVTSSWMFHICVARYKTTRRWTESEMRSALSTVVQHWNPTSHTADQEFVCCNVPLWWTDLPLGLPGIILLHLLVSYISQNAFQPPLEKGHKLALFRGNTEFSSVCPTIVHAPLASYPDMQGTL